MNSAFSSLTLQIHNKSFQTDYNDEELFNTTVFKIPLVNFFILLVKPNTNFWTECFQIQIDFLLFKMKKMVKATYLQNLCNNKFIFPECLT